MEFIFIVNPEEKTGNEVATYSLYKFIKEDVKPALFFTAVISQVSMERFLRLMILCVVLMEVE
tara:strand:+ start:138 stop:326 length:189 start_codon:yes stop_codon:yes gene_type:complete